MIVTATTEVYIATARGPVNPYHVQILPVKHAPCFAACPPDLQQALQVQLVALRKMFADAGQECLPGSLQRRRNARGVFAVRRATHRGPPQRATRGLEWILTAHRMLGASRPPPIPPDRVRPGRPHPRPVPPRVWERWIPMGMSSANHMQVQVLPIDKSRRSLAVTELAKSGGPGRASLHRQVMPWDGGKKRIRVKLVQCKADVVRETARAVGWRECDLGDDNWDVAWADTTAALFRAVQQVKPFQRVNHFPLMQIICRKDLLAQHLQTIRQLCPSGAQEFSFFPETWVLPGDLQRFWTFVQQSFEKASPAKESRGRERSKSFGRRSQRSQGRSVDPHTSDDEDQEPMTFIAKPRSAARGEGIFLFQVRASDLRAPRQRLREVFDAEKLVVQSFLEKPLLIDGYKWDMRVYVLVTSAHPLTVYLYTDGLARFCTDLYAPPSSENLEMREMHLTNFSINWESEFFEDTEDGATGSKRSLRTVLESSIENGEEIWSAIACCVKKTLLAIGPKMEDHYDRFFGRSRDGGGSACFELLGFDFILDEQQRLYLLEVNSAPSLSCPTSLDREIKENVLSEGFRLLRLDGSEKVKHAERQQQRLVDRHKEHLARREELARQKEDCRSSVGFLSSTHRFPKLPPVGVPGTLTAPVPGAVPVPVPVPEKRSEKHWSTRLEESPPKELEHLKVKNVPGFVSYLEDSETDTDRNSEDEEAFGSQAEEGSDHEAEAFRFLGIPVSPNYVQILPISEDEGIWQEIQAGATRLAQGWTAARPQSQPPRRVSQMATSGAPPQTPRSSSRPRLKTMLPKSVPPARVSVRSVLPLKTVHLGL
ncbi:unnamed protein product [Durusdinium trenchii]|uniref:Cwf19-like C-terminal domain-containing protein n=1 Tax=Durusdinium trenchii TaxID=1381693 RepID=A0ABP0R713_9DINO